MDANVVVSNTELKEILPGILWLEFPNDQVMCSSFIRFQEHYESPEFAGKYFSLEEFKTWYQGDEEEFTYYNDWSGFNIPSWVLEPFRTGKFDPLTEDEKHLLSFFEDRKDKFYVIGTGASMMSTENKLILQHETAHGLFYTNDTYKEEVLEALKALTSENMEAIRQFLINDYHENSIIDETHAYLLDGPDYLKTHKIVGDDINQVSKELHTIYRKYR